MNDNCKTCAGIADDTLREECYNGCCCFGHVCQGESCCTGTDRDSYRDAYSCTGMFDDLPLPGQSLVGLSVYDLDAGLDGSYIESFRLLEWRYKAPLRPASGNEPNQALSYNSETDTYSSYLRGTMQNNPTDPRNLTDVQASIGIQYFITPSDGWVEGDFGVVYLGAGTGTGRNIMLAGDSALCTPPPPSPPVPP
eukprot:7179131-Prymnesium_polylepis.2